MCFRFFFIISVAVSVEELLTDAGQITVLFSGFQFVIVGNSCNFLITLQQVVTTAHFSLKPLPVAVEEGKKPKIKHLLVGRHELSSVFTVSVISNKVNVL